MKDDLIGRERQWRKEERAEWDAELAAMNAHRPDCICRAVRDWTPGPSCYQARVAELEATVNEWAGV